MPMPQMGPMAMSPKTQQMQMQQDAGPDQVTALFEQGFSQAAYNLLLSKLPDLVENVVTFRVINTDIDEGSGVGAFIIQRQGQTLYIPVVMADNNTKPLEIVYHKSLNVFLPLTKGWLDEIDKMSMGELGKGVKTPETLYSDVDIRNVVVPPVTGRFSYAAYIGGIEKTAQEYRPMLLGFLDRAPNRVKQAFVNTLERNPDLLKTAVAIYGISALRDAVVLRQEKVAAKQNYGGALWIADKDTKPSEFKRIFGERSGEAYSGVKLKGYAAKDERAFHNVAMKVQPYEQYVEPTTPGVYNLYKTDMSEATAFVMPNPVNLFGHATRYGRKPVVPARNPMVDNSYTDPTPGGVDHHDHEVHGRVNTRVYPEGRPNLADELTPHDTPRYMAVFGNGDYSMVDRLVGRASIADDLSGGKLYSSLFGVTDGAAPKTGLGFFVRAKGTSFQATCPLNIKSVTTGSDGVRRILATSAEGWGEEKTLVTDPANAFGSIWMPQFSNITYVPADFAWVPLKDRVYARDLFTSAMDLTHATVSSLLSVGAQKSAVKNAGHGQFSVNGTQAVDKISALRYLAGGLNLTVEESEAILEKAASDGIAQFIVAAPYQIRMARTKLEKRAGDEDSSKKKDSGGDKKKAPPKKDGPPGSGGGDPMAGGDDPSMGGDPSMDPSMGGDPSMMGGAPMAPPPPSPTDLAAMEASQQIEQEIQKLTEKMMLVQQIAARSQEIAGGAAPMPSVQTQAMGAPPPSVNMATGAPMGQPQQPSGMGQPMYPGPSPQMGGMDPSTMGGMPPQGSMDPSMMGGAPGMQMPQMGSMMDPNMSQSPIGPMGADPSMGMGGGMSGMGQDPSMMGGPPQAMMSEDGFNNHMLEQQINPQFLGQAAQLANGDVFDAAAVSALAQSPMVKELVSQYVPNLEKALDNLARIILTMWMQESALKTEIGEEGYSELEDKLLTTHRDMGDLVLRLSQNANVLKGMSGNARS